MSTANNPQANVIPFFDATLGIADLECQIKRHCWALGSIWDAAERARHMTAIEALEREIERRNGLDARRGSTERHWREPDTTSEQPSQLTATPFLFRNPKLIPPRDFLYSASNRSAPIASGTSIWKTRSTRSSAAWPRSSSITTSLR
jgi:hypothetical protein